MTEAGHHPLVQLARAAIEAYVRHGRRLKPETAPVLVEGGPAGTFVTLHSAATGELRGCIGTIQATESSLAQEIINNAISAAARDPRFPPVRAKELEDLVIDVSVLHAPESIRSEDELDPQVYGVIVRSGWRRGLLLPDIPGIDDAATQVRYARMKADIGPDEPENTLASFDLAVRMGVQAVETDVHLSKDGAVVLIHDHTVDRTTDGHGFVKDMTVAELKALDAGRWYGEQYAGERILLLPELLEWARGRVGVALEVKNGPIYYPGIAEKTLAIVREFDMLDQVILISFDHFVLREAKIIEPRIATGILYVGALVDPVGAARAAGAESLNPNWAFVTPAMVQQAHAAGLSVSPWCPNELEPVRYLDAIGVDSIGTDYPDLLDRI